MDPQSRRHEAASAGLRATRQLLDGGTVGLCEATVVMGAQRFTCDRPERHNGHHGGVYPSETNRGPVDVRLSWTDLR